MRVGVGAVALACALVTSCTSVVASAPATTASAPPSSGTPGSSGTPQRAPTSATMLPPIATTDLTTTAPTTTTTAGRTATTAATTTAATAATTTTVAPAPNPPTVRIDQIVSHGAPGRHRVALTFDSNMTAAMLQKLDRGTVASYANIAVLDQLDALKVPATFFLAGLWMERYPEVTARLAATERYELGTHSYAHKGFTASCYSLGTIANDAMQADVQRGIDVLRRFTDHPVPYYRFPGLCVDQAALDAIAPLGLTVVHGDVPSGDAFGTDPQAIVRQTLRGAHDGAIVVLHITGGDTAPRTQDAIGPIVAGLRDAGYELVKVSELLRG